MSEVVIRTENLGKKYRIGSAVTAYKTLRELVNAKVKGLGKLVTRPWSFGTARRSNHAEFWALRDISFEVRQGEIVGIIGRNGAGKSTLLKILSRITTPTTGTAVITGRVASLLEIGTGFHPELTGTENIFLNGSILGMSRVEINKKFDAIVDFAEIEKFIDTPVKHYSSGMSVRLAFAVAAHLDSEILMIDEVLAVGDSEFQRKCIGKMKNVSRGGRTVLFVSHNLGAITKLCSKAVLLNQGRIQLIDDPVKAVKCYLSQGSRSTLQGGFRGPLQSSLKFHRITLSADPGEGESQYFSPGSAIQLNLIGECISPIRSYRTSISLFRDGARLFTLHDVEEPQDLSVGFFESTFKLPPYLLRPGEYHVSIGGGREGKGAWMWGNNLLNFSILEEWSPGYESYSPGLINLHTTNSRRMIEPFSV